MHVSIWDKLEKKHLYIKNVKHIHQSCQSLHYFDLDDKEYDTERYELNFIHSD